jgi:23S rRNA (uracil1939-C5)-methyltransferase
LFPRTKPKARRGIAPAPVDAADVTIERIGADGDGIGHLPDGQTVYLPFTLPGEHVRATGLRRHGQGWLATAEHGAAGGEARVEPPCQHFGTCGGCALQHWRPDAYLAWKTNLLRHALTRAGFIDPPLHPIVSCPPASRRRMDLAVRRTASGVVLGLHRVRSTEVVDLAGCAVLHPTLAALLDPLRHLLAGLATPWRQASVVANLLDGGPDLLLRTGVAPTASDRATLADFARRHDVPRIAWAEGNHEPEPVALLRPPLVTLSGVAVTPPPGAFLQATESGEHAIIAAVLAALLTPHAPPLSPLVVPPLSPRARIAEFHAGCGTLTFALARHAHVQAWEGDGPAVAALSQAANRAGLAGRVRAAQRDLARQPVRGAELAGFAAIVLDPPHAGALEQMTPIATSGVPVVIHVGCNPAALARDAAVLRQGGYALAAATPIDQFLWSPRLESVCVFRLDRR